MMKKVLLMAFVVFAMTAHAQVGIGTNKPDQSALLDIKNPAGSNRGLLIPRVKLTKLDDSSTFGDKGATESLLIYNENSTSELGKGFYYWTGAQWTRIFTDKDIETLNFDNTTNYSLTIESDKALGEDVLVITDSAKNKVQMPLSTLANNSNFINKLTSNNEFIKSVKALETITTITPVLDKEGERTGEYVYKNEDGDEVKIDVVGDVNHNFKEIVANIDNQIYIFRIIEENSKDLISNEGTISVRAEHGSVLADTYIDVVDKSLTVRKLNSMGAKGGELLSADGKGNVIFRALTSEMIKDAGSITTDNIITVDSGKNKVLSDVKFSLADSSVTSGKLSSTGADKGTVATADGSGNVTYSKVSAANLDGKGSITGDNIIEVSNGANTTLGDVSLSLADNSVTTGKLSSGQAAKGTVATADGSGNVTYSKVSAANLDGKGSITGDNIIEVSNGANTTLGDVSLSLADNSVTTGKLNSTGADKGTVATADGAGNVTYSKVSAANLDGKGSITGDNIIEVSNGTNTTLGDVSLSLADNSVTSGKLNSGQAAKGTVATADGAGNVTYSKVSAANLDGKGSITGDDIIEVSNGANTTLGDVAFSINNASIKAEKLNSTGADKGTVATADGAGKVTYSKVSTANLDGKGSITGDNIIEVSNGANATLGDVSLSLADNSVTSGKLSSGQAANGTVATADGAGKVTYSKVSTANLDGKGSITGDSIIEVSNGTNATLGDVSLSLADNSVTSGKLNSGQAAKGTVATADGSGNVTYSKVSAANLDGKGSITGDDIIEVSNGANTTLGDVAFSINKASIEADKLSSRGVIKGSVATADGTGKVVYEPITASVIKNSGSITTDDIIKVDSGKNKVLSDVKFSLAENSVKANKLSSEGSVNGTVATADGNGKVVYKAITASNINGIGNITTDGVISVDDGNRKVFGDVKLSLKDESISTKKLIDHAVTQEKLWAGENKKDFVATATASGNVVYKPLSEVQKTGEFLADNSITVSSATGKPLLEDVKIGVSENGITTVHVENKAITTEKIGSSQNDDSTMVLTADGVGGANFVKVDNIITTVSKGDIIGNESISVSGGTDVLVGTDDKKVAIGINNGGVKTNHLAPTSVSTQKIQDNAITTAKVGDNQVTATKLSSGQAANGTVAMADGTGKVTYAPITASSIDGLGNISTDGVIAVDNGDKKTFGDVGFSINDKSIGTGKLTSGNASKGTVATADGSGNVTYAPIAASSIDQVGNVTTDGIIVVDNGDETVLKTFNLSIADNGIDNSKIADKAITTSKIDDNQVTIAKLSSETEGENQILTTDGNGGFNYTTIGQLQNKAFDITTDGIIGFGNGDGTKAVLKDIKLTINDNSIAKDKLTSESQPVDMLLVTDGKGGFDYVLKEAVQAGGYDLKVGNSLEFVNGDGLNAVLAPTTIVIKDKGITTAKLADSAVTTEKLAKLSVTADKISSNVNGQNAGVDNVLTSNGEGGTEFKSLTNLVFDKGEALNSDTSIYVDPNNKAVLHETNIRVADLGIDTKHLKDNSVVVSKLNSEGAKTNTVLTADGKGKASYKSVDELVFTQGKQMSNEDGSIEIKNGEKAVLTPMNINVKEGGIVNSHIAENTITESKLNSEQANKGFALVSDGNGGAKYEDISQYVQIEGEALSGVGAIAVDGGNQALLSEASISIKNKGITNDKIADKTITAIKVNSENAPKGAILASMGDGEAKFININTYAGDIASEDGSITVSSGDKTVLKDVSLDVSPNGILTKHIANKQVTTNKINAEGSKAGTILMSDGNGNAQFKELEIEKSIVNYSYDAQDTGKKWLNTPLKVIEQVFDITLNEPTNKVVIPGVVISNEVLSIRLIKKGENSISEGLIKKEISGGNTILYLGMPGFLTTYHPKGDYYLILEYTVN